MNDKSKSQRAFRIGRALSPIMLFSVGLVLVGEGIAIEGLIGTVFIITSVLAFCDAVWTRWNAVEIDEQVETTPMSPEDRLRVQRAVDEWRYRVHRHS